MLLTKVFDRKSHIKSRELFLHKPQPCHIVRCETPPRPADLTALSADSMQKEYKVNEVMETLKARQLDLEHHIQSELIELSEVVNKQYGNSDQKFDYQLIRVTDNRPAPVW